MTTDTRKRRVKVYPGQRFAIAQKVRASGRLAGFDLTVDEKLRRDVLAIRSASRKAGEDDGYVVRFFSMCETHVVGPEGFYYQNKAKKNGELDETANTLIEQHFKKWGKKGVCDVTGQYSWLDMQRLFIKTVAQDGAILVREVFGFPNEYGYALQLLETDHLDINYSRNDYNGNIIRHGVELDEWGRHIAYHILTSHPGEESYFYGNNRYQRIPAEQIIYGFYPFRIGQKIGVPWAHAALVELIDLYNYREAEITSARVAASKMFAYVPDTDVEPAEDDDEEEFQEEATPGSGLVVPYGYTIDTLDFKTDSSNAAGFTKTSLRGASSGFDVNYNSLANDLEGVNFSSIRHGVLEDRDNWKKKQAWMRETLCERIHSNWLTFALVSGKIGNYTILEFERLNVPFFQGRRWEWVNPLQDEKANTEAINNRTKSPQQIIRERGQDPNEIIKEFKEWHEQTKDLPSNNNEAKTDNSASDSGD